MDSELSRFQHLFDNEAVLRSVLVQLLRRIPEIEGVQLTHGTQELGKDIVFYSLGPLREKRLCACVVKNSPISGSVDSLSGAMTVLHQVHQALDNPYINGNGEPERVAVVYVISPFELSQPAIRSIQGSLDKRSGQTTFRCGGHLLEQFKEYFPEFLVFESGALGSYIAAVQRQVDSDDPLSTLSEQHALIARAGASFKENYVRQGFRQEVRTFRLVCGDVPDLTILSSFLSTESVRALAVSVESSVRLINAPYLAHDSGMTDSELSELTMLLGHRFRRRLDEAWAKVSGSEGETRFENQE